MDQRWRPLFGKQIRRVGSYQGSFYKINCLNETFGVLIDILRVSSGILNLVGMDASVYL